MIETLKLCWQDYLDHPWMRKVVAAGLGVELAAVWVVPWFWRFWQ